MQKIICFLCCLLLGTNAFAENSEWTPEKMQEEIWLDEISFDGTSLENDVARLLRKTTKQGLNLRPEYHNSPASTQKPPSKISLQNISLGTAIQALGNCYGLESTILPEDDKTPFRLVFYKKIAVRSVQIHAVYIKDIFGYNPDQPQFSFADFVAQKTIPGTFRIAYDPSIKDLNSFEKYLNLLIAEGAKITSQQPPAEERFLLLAAINTSEGPVYFGVSAYRYYGFLNLQLPKKSSSWSIFYEVRKVLPESYRYEFQWLSDYIRDKEIPVSDQKSVDLDDGYEAVTVETEIVTPVLDHTSRWTHLQHGKELSPPIGLYALSPNERHIVYQDLSTGKIFLLDKPTHRKIELYSTFPGLVLRFDWPANVETIRVELYNKEPIFLNPSVGTKENTASGKPSSAD